MRADARRNQQHLLAVAREVVAEQGTSASMREIARRAAVGLGTLQRHFTTRDDLFEALLRSNLDALTRRAAELQEGDVRFEELASWFADGVAFVRTYGGLVDLLAEAVADPTSRLHTSCVAVRSAGGALLASAQERGVARKDLDGTELFALMGAVGWIGNQSAFAAKADHLEALILTVLASSR